MVGRPSFLILTTIICVLSLWVLFYALFGVDDGTIRLEAGTVSTVALLTVVISLAFLLMGIVFRTLTRPVKTETLVMR